MTHENMDQSNHELDHLLQNYRVAVPDPEASSNFMPEMWRKIEARQMFLLRFKKMTQVFVAAAAAICLLLGIALQTPLSTSARQSATSVAGNYVDVLANTMPTENLSEIGIRIDYTEPNGR